MNKTNLKCTFALLFVPREVLSFEKLHSIAPTAYYTSSLIE